MNKFALIAIAGVLSSTAASAADLATAYQPNTVAYSPASAFNWSGFYAGANVGYGFGRAQLSGNAVLDVDINGVLGGVQAGYNHDFGGFVLGVEGDFQFADLKYSETVGATTSTFSVDRFGTIRARAGLAVDRFLPYVTGGVAIANGKVRGENGGAVILEENQTSVGWTLGAGVEYAVTDNVTVKAEYLYADFGKANYAGTNVDFTARSNIVRAGVNFKF